MNVVRKRKMKLIMLLVAIVGLAIGLVLYALGQNISLFYSPSQIVHGDAPLNRTIRVGGMVVKGSVIRKSELTVQFTITDNAQDIDISYRGILPDLFREGQGIVAQGKLVDKTHVNAVEVLAKHDENYMPPEVKASMVHKSEKGG